MLRRMQSIVNLIAVRRRYNYKGDGDSNLCRRLNNDSQENLLKRQVILGKLINEVKQNQ